MVRRSPWWSRTTLITWSQKVTCKTEELIFPLLQGLYHQAWQVGDVWSQWTTHGVTWLSDYAVLWGYMKIYNEKLNWSKTLIRAKKIKIGILENKFTRKLILLRQSNLFLQSFLMQNFYHSPKFQLWY